MMDGFMEMLAFFAVCIFIVGGACGACAIHLHDRYAVSVQVKAK